MRSDQEQGRRVRSWLAAPLVVFARLTRPLTLIMSGTANVVVRRLGFRPALGEEMVHSVEELAKLIPDMATRVVGEKIEDVPVGELHEGDLVLVRPGASVPTDGVVRDVALGKISAARARAVYGVIVDPATGALDAAASAAERARRA